MNNTTQPKRFIILGDAGAGKSSFINFLYNYFHGTKNPKEIFCAEPKVKLAIPCANWVEYLDEKYRNNANESDINDQTKSQTQSCKTYSIETEDMHLELIDTPGFNDTNGIDRDEQNLIMIEEKIAEIPYINGLIIIINGSNPRIGVSFNNCLRMLYQVWPTELLTNSVAILTNCDELSANFDLSILEKKFKIDLSRTFYIQNSLFRGNPKMPPSKAMNRIQDTFEQNLEMITPLMDTLRKFRDVPTDLFKNGAMKVFLIEENVKGSIMNMIRLIEKYNEQQIAYNGMINAQNTMTQNQQWKKRREINAITYVEMRPNRQLPKESCQRRLSYQEAVHEQESRISTYPPGYYPNSKPNPNAQDDLHAQSSFSLRSAPRVSSLNGEIVDNLADASLSVHKDQSSTNSTNKQNQLDKLTRYYKCVSDKFSRSSSNSKPYYQAQKTKIQVTIPDNEAVSHHRHAQEEAHDLTNKLYDLDYQTKALKTSLQELKEDLKNKVAELNSINENYDILEAIRDQLIQLQKIIATIDHNRRMQKYYDEIIAILSKQQD